jgi:hypothetical protein
MSRYEFNFRSTRVGNRRITSVKILDTKSRGKNKMIAAGMTVQSGEDLDRKAFGQKHAVTNALRADVQREKRGKIWEDFFNFSKDTRKLIPSD